MSQSQTSAKAIFLQALELATAERAAYVETQCGNDPGLRREVEALLAEHQRLGSFMESPAATLDRFAGERPGAQIGPYKILQQIGEGGMGVVYMAEQTAPVQRRVALKIIKPGMDSRQVIARFAAEKQALALMDHVNIARVLDAGTTGGEPGGVSPGSPPPAHAGGSQGRPYFVMELVHGVPITKYCDDNHLTPRQRLNCSSRSARPSSTPTRKASSTAISSRRM